MPHVANQLRSTQPTTTVVSLSTIRMTKFIQGTVRGGCDIPGRHLWSHVGESKSASY